MLSAESLMRIEASPGWRRHRVEILHLPEGRVVIKGQRPPRSTARFWIMHALARFSSNPLLRPVPAPGGREAQQTEVRRLRALSSAGIRVPPMLHVGTDYLVLGFVEGTPLSSLLTDKPLNAEASFRQALDDLADVHDRGQYLSQAFARNTIVTTAGAVFLDFEDDPLDVMSLPDAQARDWLAFLLSSIWCTNVKPNTMLFHWTAVQPRIAPMVGQRIVEAASRLEWLRHLPKERKPWGRDVISLQALAEFLTNWQRSLPVTR